MNSLVENMANQETELAGLDFVELGDVSIDTRGSIWGHTGDGGFGVKFP